PPPHRPRRPPRPRHRHRQPRHQASDRLHLSLRLRHADRRGAAHNLFPLYRRWGEAMSYGWPILSTITFLTLLRALLICLLRPPPPSPSRPRPAPPSSASCAAPARAPSATPATSRCGPRSSPLSCRSSSC